MHDALDSLAEGGWLTWTVGAPSRVAEERKPSSITLHPVDTPGRFRVKDLPNPELKPLYASDHAGNHGYLIVCRVLGDPQRTGPYYSTGDLVKLTGLNARAVQRAMPKLWAGFRKVKGGWQVDDIESLCSHGVHATSTQTERTARLSPRRERGKPSQDGKGSSWFDPSTDWPCIVEGYESVAEGAAHMLRNIDTELKPAHGRVIEPEVDPTDWTDAQVIEAYRDSFRLKSKRNAWPKLVNRMTPHQMDVLVEHEMARR
jgi:hypothetical protein